MSDTYVISEDPTDIEAGLAPAHYGDPATSCTGEGDTSPATLGRKIKAVAGAARFTFSSYPNRPAYLDRYGSAYSRGWGAGWPSCSTSRMVAIVGGDVRLTLRKEIAEIVRLLLNWSESNLKYEIYASQTGGFNCRNISGTNVASNHSWGLAIDINWSSNPYSSRFTCNIPPKLIEAFWQCGFYWGGWYSSGRYDTMHFEYIGKPSSAATHLARARAITGSSAGTSSTTSSSTTSSASSGSWGPYYTGAVGSRTMEEWDRGDDVKWVQQRLGVLVTGNYGPLTKTEVREFQSRNGIPTTGGVGPQTLAMLRRTQVSLSGLLHAHNNPTKVNADAKQVQQALNARNYDCGTPDGRYGPRTKDAMTKYRAALYDTYPGHPDTVGAPGVQTLHNLGFAVIA